MSTPRSPAGWTLDTLYKFFAERVDSLEKRIISVGDEREERNKERFAAMKTAVDAALASSDRAVTKAELATERRFESVNEFRATLQDQAALMLPRAEFNVQHKTLVDTVQLNSDRMSLLETTLNSRLTAIEAKTSGKTEGVSSVTALILGGFAIISSIAAVLALLTHNHG